MTRWVPCDREDMTRQVQAMDKNDKPSTLKEQIDENLRRVYQEALQEKIPDRFQELLDQLRQKKADK